jgi:hypothetical protein
MERGKSSGFVNSIGALMAATLAVVTGGGNTKAIEVNRERSESWQQDMAQVIIAGMSWPQSI